MPVTLARSAAEPDQSISSDAAQTSPNTADTASTTRDRDTDAPPAAESTGASGYRNAATSRWNPGGYPLGTVGSTRSSSIVSAWKAPSSVHNGTSTPTNPLVRSTTVMAR